MNDSSSSVRVTLVSQGLVATKALKRYKTFSRLNFNLKWIEINYKTSEGKKFIKKIHCYHR